MLRIDQSKNGLYNFKYYFLNFYPTTVENSSSAPTKFVCYEISSTIIVHTTIKNKPTMPTVNFIDELEADEKVVAGAIIKKGEENFICCDLEHIPQVVCINCLCLMGMGSYAQHRGQCAGNEAVDPFSDLPGGRGKKKKDSANFWRDYFPTFAAVVARDDKKTGLTEQDISEETDIFKMYAKELLRDYRRKCANRRFYRVTRNKQAAILLSPHLKTPLRALCLEVGDEGVCGHAGALNHIAAHLTSHEELPKIMFHRCYVKKIEIDMGGESDDENRGKATGKGTSKGVEVIQGVGNIHEGTFLLKQQ